MVRYFCASSRLHWRTHWNTTGAPLLEKDHWNTTVEKDVTCTNYVEFTLRCIEFTYCQTYPDTDDEYTN